MIIIRKITLVICEKPSAAWRIATALSLDGHIRESRSNNSSEVKNSSRPVRVPNNSSFITVKGSSSQNYIICHALGHLYGLSDIKKGEQSFPILNPSWQVLFMQKNGTTKSKQMMFKIQKILNEVSEASKVATDFIHACDYDQEGEVIGYNILQYACNNKYSISRRAKFSSLTDEDIINSFNNLLPPNHNLKDAGISRHVIDFIYGINLSRALTGSVNKGLSNNTNKKVIQLSIGRVQGPTLAFVVEREKAVLSHVSTPYWNIQAYFQKNDLLFKAHYFPRKLESKKLALQIIFECKNQFGRVSEIETVKIPISPPAPFNLGDLQKEAYSIFKFEPSYTLSIAEKLYLGALISYPRTSSQKLPQTINFKKIISNINMYSNREDLEKCTTSSNVLSYHSISTNLLLQKHLIPNEGKQEDSAHPAIYPTGEKIKWSLTGSESKLLDLIIRRFFSTFGPQASQIQVLITITVNDKHIFKTDEKKIISEGWTRYYRPYFDSSNYATQEKLSILKEYDNLKVMTIELLEKTTQAPPRYNQSTLLQKMEREKIGTKSTRSEIINTLFKRNYIYDYNPSLSSHNQIFDITRRMTWGMNAKSEKPNNLVQKIGEQQEDEPGRDPIVIHGSQGIRPTELGNTLVNTMQKYIPSILSTILTRSMEEQLEQIEAGNINSVTVVDQARKEVKEMIKSYGNNQDKISLEIALSLEKNKLTVSSSKTDRLTSSLGKCPVCKKGNLIVRKSMKTKKRFAGCTNYSINKCTATAPLPHEGILRSSGNRCKECSWPIVTCKGLNQDKKYQWKFCINSQCSLKKTR